MWVTVSPPQRLGRSIQLGAGTHVLGRATTCDLVIDDPSVSMRHALLYVSEQGAWLTDLQSSNGTFVGHQQLQAQAQVWLTPPAEFRIGQTNVCLTTDPPATATPAPPPTWGSYTTPSTHARIQPHLYGPATTGAVANYGGSTGRGHQPRRRSVMAIIADFLGIVTALLALWEFGARLDIIEGPGPIERVNDAVQQGSLPGFSGSNVTVQAPSHVRIKGNCNEGYTITWDPVPNADIYFIEKDGGFFGLETGTSFHTSLFSSGKTHTFRVRAGHAGQQSDPSKEVTAGPCSPPTPS